MRIDHLVVAAADLEEGCRWVVDRLGTRPVPGGRHVEFGTHNALIGLGDSYLEVIAVEPDARAGDGGVDTASSLGQPRWFALDTEEMQARLAAGPALVHWVARVERMPDDPQVLAMHGVVRELSRGENRWRLTVPPDGELPGAARGLGGGAVPSLIEWLTPSPSQTLPDSGFRLVRLEALTPAAPVLASYLQGIDCPATVHVAAAEQTGLRATLMRGTSTRVLL